MRFAFGFAAIAAGVVALSVPAVAAPQSSRQVIERFGIERVQAEPAADVPRSGTERRGKAAPKKHHRRAPPSDPGTEEDRGAGSNADRSPDVDPPGCHYRKAPLELIV
jgi:hypothetical protein